MSGKWVKIADIAAVDLDADTKISLVSVALTELAAAQALVMIHGRERGSQRYAEAGGCVRFDDAGDPCIPVAAAARARAEGA